MPNLESQSFFSQQNQTAQNQADQDLLYTFNYGGINIESSPINLPLSDSPDMTNMDISLSGKLQKRGGSILRSNEVGYPFSIIVPVQLPTGEYLVWTKLGTSMIGYLFQDTNILGTATKMWTFSNVFCANAGKEKPSWVLTSEEYPRIIMVCPSNVPIEVQINNKEFVGNNTNSYTIVGDFTSYFSTTYGYAIYNFTTNKLTGCTYNAGTGLTTFTLTSTVATGQRFTIVSPTWAWWAESIKRVPTQCYDSNVRFNTSVSADANVECPVEIRRGLFADYLAFGLGTGVMPCVLTANTRPPITFFSAVNPPTSSTEFAWSDLQYVSGGTVDDITMGSTYVTFGGITGAGTSPPTPVHFVRFHFLPFNGGTGIQGQYVAVNDHAGNAWTWRNTSASRGASVSEYWLTASYTIVTSATPTTACNGIRFDASTPFGLRNAEFIEITNKQPGGYVGSGATAVYASAVLGGYKPIYGISEYANYATGVFPTVISLYQNRICLGGFSTSPLTILMSNVKDYGSRFYYQNYQIYMEDTAFAENPVEVVINGSVNERIRALTDWYNSLFVFTDNTVNRVYGGDSVAVTPTNKFLSNIATIGCLSSHNVTKTDRNVMFVGKGGIYKIDVLPEVGDYYVTSISLKINKFVTDPQSYLKNAWVAFNQNLRTLYVGMSDGYDVSICERLFVFNVERESWGEYALFNGYMPSCAGACFNGRTVILLVKRDNTPSVTAGATSEISLVEFNYPYKFIDCIQSAAVSPYTVIGQTTARIQVTINDAQRIVGVSKRLQDSNKGFKLLPVNDFYHTRVQHIQGSIITGLTGGTDYIYRSQKNSLRFNRYPWTTGDTVVISLLDDNQDVPVGIFKNNIRLTEDTDYTISIITDYEVTFTDALDPSDNILVGYEYPCYHVTPTFFRQSANREKRTIHYIGYYTNTDYQEVYTSDDANTSAGQSASEIADRYEINANVNVAFLYNDTNSGTTSTDLYLGSQIIWDVSMFDVNHSPFQRHEVVRIIEPIIGVGYSFAVCNFSFDTNTFELVGYQIETSTKGRNSRAWF